MFDGFFGLLGLVALAALIVAAVRQNNRLGLLERQTGALRSFVFSGASPAMPAGVAAAPADRASAASRIAPENAAEAVSEPVDDRLAVDRTDLPGQSETAPRGDVPPAPAPKPVDEPDTSAAPPPRPTARPRLRPRARPRSDLETTLGTQWAVWVGGVALAFGGIFLVKYTIEAGLFGPAFRLTMAALFGVAMLAFGEYIRRTGFKVPVPGMATAYIPAILTAVGALTLFATVYAAHGVYGFIGPATAFVLLGVVGVATTLLALIHGQALAGVGLLGSFATPVLVSSQSPNPWALFGFLAIVLVSAIAVSRTRRWRLMASLAFAGAGLWCLVYIAEAPPVDLDIWVVLFINAVMLGALALVWLHGEDNRVSAPVAHVFPSAVPAFFVALVGIAMVVDSELQGLGSKPWGLALLAAMLAIAAWRVEAIALLFGAGIATILAFIRIAFAGALDLRVMGATVTVDGVPVGGDVDPLFYPGIGLAILFLALGLWQGRALVNIGPRKAAFWVVFAAAVPLVIAGSLWLGMGNPNIDFGYAAAVLVVTAVLLVGSEWIARAETPPLRGGPAVSGAISGAAAGLALALHMACGPGLTTILIGVGGVLPALATRLRAYPIFGWLCLSAVVVVLVRVAIDPSIVGVGELGTTPVFNALLPGYGIPALAFGFAAWQLARTTGGRPFLAMQAAAALFALLTLAMLVRHAMNGGTIDAGYPTLAEQAIDSIIAFGAGGILIALDQRAPSSVFRYGSMAIGVISVAAVVLQHFLLLNPVFTNEFTGRIPVLNLLFLAYLLPALAAGALAYYARPKRPRWYAIMLALTGAALAFAYVTLSVRRVFKGEFIGFWSGTGDGEFYAYSAVWLLLGVVLLVIGVRANSFVIRAASGILIALSVAKVFLLDMSALEGVLRAFSFMGLGAVLIGIGLFYQRLLTRGAKPETATTPV